MLFGWDWFRKELWRWDSRQYKNNYLYMQLLCRGLRVFT